ncbi:DNA cytosine methyltransferase [Mesorhizobium sp. M1273]|uniref:DNA cytosine methyltransferase n=1 Tax=Mesorhizobium sp. M1273 TaxID=2957075 RepID=UPI0033373AB0
MQHSFSTRAKELVRHVRVSDTQYDTVIPNLADDVFEGHAAWWQSVLRGAKAAPAAHTRPPLRVVDAFCGSGGLALGVKFAAEAIGRNIEFPLIIDTDITAMEIHRHNLGARRTIGASASSLVDFHVVGSGENASFGYEPETVHPELENVGHVDLFIAGPPCQGHSNLNNHTRRQDPRNDLYVTAAALGVALGAEAIIIENVPTVQNSHSDVVATAVALLKSAGYFTSMSVLKADNLGAAQRRARHFLLATRGQIAPDHLATHAGTLAMPAMPISWAIGDLIDLRSDELVNSPPTVTQVNGARIDYLFDHDIYDLPDAQRPDCHKNGTSYTAVYGRMHWDRPAQTITTGFGTPGQGRYVHPKRRRLITPREAARIQGFPDWFDFAPASISVKRKHLAKWIGDAVHPALGYAVGLSALAVLEIALPQNMQSAA